MSRRASAITAAGIVLSQPTTPTSGRARSASVNPVPFSIARAAARSTPSVSAALRLLAGSVGPYGSTDAMNLLGYLPLVQGPQPLPHLLDLRLGELAPVVLEARRAAIHLRDPLARERAVADRGQDGAHVLAHVVVDDLRADGVRSVLGGVGDREVHP